MRMVDCFVMWRVTHSKTTWNLYETEGPRTNNHLEGWHNGLQQVLSEVDKRKYNDSTNREPKGKKLSV